MTRYMTALALVALVTACGGAREESRDSRRQEERREARADRARAERVRAERARAEERGEGDRDDAINGEAQAGVPRGEAEPRIQSNPQAMLGRDTIARLQRELGRRGLLSRHEEGTLDVPTRDAIGRFQQQQGLAATGIPDRQTLIDLGVSPERAYGRGPGDRG